ncbi:2-succinyl-6-hydroxy-2,4-cyclohexadiene-1-carboxylate synthase [Terribacillus saccharophilus]|uniref:2-succinyl-6-hydroxy-2, 4-cyclohexadiene-1-carboxylate synthase n=1 Tax=Terribacillus saccharophilus TaxID=361277 RepID=UPI00298A0673|nr:2-succinyl-6-hydroxy-2,4-cyclohexadiene-1-carboxylate synthase [Terribacillus saccharophilus]MCM3226292.1 2-succinyl-6-hydroxy-2,4-cyclohexadiene-1-carboxylate synthase [Terribacillus saccharophilus]
MPKFHYIESGSANAPDTLLLFHGFTGTHQTWLPFLESWSEKHHVIAVDMPGHGQTAIQDDLTMDRFTDDVAEFLDQHGVAHVKLCGYSMGGRAALAFACRYPDRISELLLESASPGLQTEEERLARQMQDERLASRLMTDGLVQFIDFWENIPLFDTQKNLPKFIQQIIREERLSQQATGLAISLRTMGTGKQDSYWDKLPYLDKPVILVAGSMDHKFVGINQEMEKRLPATELHIVAAAGHCVHVEQPRIFDKIVRRYLLHIEADILEES